MKFNFLLLLAVGLFFTSCGSDECTQDDWVGTYTGTISCPDEDPEDTTYVITAGATDNEILIDGDAVTFDGCKISITEVDPFFGAEITLELELDGNNLNGTASTTLLGITATCDITSSK